MVAMHTFCCMLIYGGQMCCNLNAPNAGQTPGDRINWCSDVTMVIGCIVMLMIEMPDRHMTDRIN